MNKKEILFIGWDIGGAHLKLAIVDSNSHVLLLKQFPTPVWKGIEFLANQIDVIKNTIFVEYSQKEIIHAVTMTAELCDCFDDREQGVIRITQLLSKILVNQPLYFYAAKKGFLKEDNIDTFLVNLASSNWHATTSYAALNYDEGILIDIGSTTTDVISFKDKKLLNIGSSDYERLKNNELVYTGIIRTPIMAISDHVKYDGSKIDLMAEYFATTADVYRVLDMLDERSDQSDTADGRGKTKKDSLLRLRRMIGLDSLSSDHDEENTIEMASYLFKIQSEKIIYALQRIIEKAELDQNLYIIRAGCGADILSNMIKSLHYNHTSFSNMINDETIQDYIANTCATAVSVAELLRKEYAY